MKLEACWEDDLRVSSGIDNSTGVSYKVQVEKQMAQRKVSDKYSQEQREKKTERNQREKTRQNLVSLHFWFRENYCWQNPEIKFP